jgi:hypothetical protein
VVRWISAILMFAGTVLASYAQVSVTTSRNNNNRDGQNLSETVLTPSNVNVDGFGRLFVQNVDGYVYAQPLYVPNVTIPKLGKHNVLYVATEHDSVYAFDADSNKGKNASALWHRTFINPTKGITTVSSQDQNCTDIVPEMGITSTPVIDSNAGTMYVVVRTKENAVYRQRLHALDITTGKERAGSPIVIAAKVKGTGDGSSGGILSFDPYQEGDRPGLLLQNGAVYIGWASYCDHDPWHSWLMSYDASTLKQTGVWNGTPNGGRGGVWQGGSGIAADANFNIYFATGNGTFDANAGGKDYGDSVMKLSPPVNKHMAVTDYFTPFNQMGLSGGDRDLGSGGVLLLPDQGTKAPHKHLLIAVGKEGSIYLISRDKMGHFHAKNNSQIVQDLEDAIGGMFTAATWWNNNVYFGGIHDNLRQYTFDTKAGLLSTSAIAKSETIFGFPGTSTSISANGTSNAILWALEKTTTVGVTPVILHAYDATNISTELYNSDQNSSRDAAGNAVKFAVPTIANGKVYVPAIKQVSVYGLLGGAVRKGETRTGQNVPQ